MGDGKVGAVDVIWVSVAAAICIGLALGVLALRDNEQRRRARQPVIDVAQHVRYVHDQRADVCFALTWTGEDDRRAYLMAWVPCMERLPVATTSTVVER
jgi:hypothetical protein